MNRFYLNEMAYVKGFKIIVVSRRLSKLISKKSAKDEWIKTYIPLDTDKICSDHFNFLLIGPDGLILATRRID